MFATMICCPDITMQKLFAYMTRADVAIAIALFSLAITGWQAWRQRDTPLQALVFQSQLAAVESLVENARLGCKRRICTDYYNQENEEMNVCKGGTLDEAFGKVQDATNALKMIASQQLLDVVTRFGQMHNAHALGNDDPDSGVTSARKPDPEAVRFALLNKCEREVDEFVNEFRATMGLAGLSSGLLTRIGTEAMKRPQRPSR